MLCRPFRAVPAIPLQINVDGASKMFLQFVGGLFLLLHVAPSQLLDCNSYRLVFNVAVSTEQRRIDE